MDVKYINPFIMSIKHVFATMVHTEVNVQKPQLKPQGAASADVSGIIGFSGDAAGCVVLSFPTEVACKVASTFAGTHLGPSDRDFPDAIGELTNMVAGCAKKEFEGINVSISLPSVVIGSNHVVAQSRGPLRVIIPCETKLGPLFVEVAMEVARKAAPQPAVAGAAV